MDRRLAAILAICLVISTISSALIFGERAEGITVVENAHPERVYTSRERGSYRFQIGLVSRERFEILQIDYFCMRITDRNLSLTLDRADLDSISELLPEISAIRNMCEHVGGEPEILDLDVAVNGEDATLRLVDFTTAFLAFAPSGIRQFPEGARAGLLTSPDAATAFGILFDGDGEAILSCQGVRDFFLDRELLLSDLYIRRNDQVASYTSCREAPQPEGSRILDAPRGGRSLFSGVERDDRLEVGFSVNSAWIPPGLSVLQLVRILGDLEETVVLLNLMG